MITPARPSTRATTPTHEADDQPSRNQGRDNNRCAESTVPSLPRASIINHTCLDVLILARRFGWRRLQSHNNVLL
jgi:hypothetical protein